MKQGIENKIVKDSSSWEYGRVRESMEHAGWDRQSLNSDLNSYRRSISHISIALRFENRGGQGRQFNTTKPQRRSVTCGFRAVTWVSVKVDEGSKGATNDDDNEQNLVLPRDEERNEPCQAHVCHWW